MSTQTGKKIIPSDRPKAAVLEIFGQDLGQQILSDAARKELDALVQTAKNLAKNLEANVDQLQDIKARIFAFEQRNGYSLKDQYFTSLNGQTRNASMATNYFRSDSR